MKRHHGTLTLLQNGLVHRGGWTLLGALGAELVSDPSALGLDAAVPAAFLALLTPRINERDLLAVALASAVVAVMVVPLVPAGVPMLCAASIAVVFGLTKGDA